MARAHGREQLLASQTSEKELFSTLNAFSKKDASSLEERTNGRDKALGVVRGARETRRQLRK